MDRLAASGVRFDQARAHNVVTLPSHANILAGLSPLHHGVRDNSGFRFPDDRPTLATILKAHGYRTGAFVSAYPLDSRFGLNRGFDVYDDDFLDAVPGQHFLIQERNGVETVARARRWMAAGPEPWFAWVHLYEPHYPYSPPEPIAARFRGSEYDGEVAAADAALAPLLEPILAETRSGRTLIVLTSDHGESLGEHGEATHGIFAYESTLRVPLILHLGQAGQGRVVTSPAWHTDLLPTILETLGFQVPPNIDGDSLVAQIQGGQRPADPAYFEALSGTLNRGWAPLRGVVRDRFKFVDLPLPELYDLGADPREERNLAEAQRDRVSEMRALLASVRGREVGLTRKFESAEARGRLASLGYVAGSGEVRAQYTDADDPKRLMNLDAILQEVMSLYAQGDLEAAVARCRDLIRERPSMSISLLYLAQLERERGDLPAAIDSLQKALALNPADTTTVATLGAYLTQAGRADEALRVLSSDGATGEEDEQVVVARALALATLRRFPEALDQLDWAARRNPAGARHLIESGTIHLMAGDNAKAQQTFERAVEINPDAARAHSSLGVIAAQGGNHDAAVRHWQRAVELDPREYDKLLALGVALARAGRPGAARPYLEFFVAFAPSTRYAADIDRARRWLSQPR